MINTKDLKRLAEMVVEEKKVSREVIDLVFNKMHLQDQRHFLYQLQSAIARHRVYVRTAGEPGKSLKDMINRKYAGRDIIFETSDKLGAGLEIQDNDDVIRMNIKSMIEKTFEQLREDL